MLPTFIKLNFVEILYTIVETLPNFIKRKHPRKGEKKEKKGVRTKSVGKQTTLKKGKPPRGERNHSKLNLLPLVARKHIN
jgi:hypothetical protein